MTAAQGGRFHVDFGSVVLKPKQLLIASVLVLVAAVILGGSQLLIGPNTATAGYLTILFLLSVVRASSWRPRLSATVWSLAVALLGFAVGSMGLVPTLIALVVVSIVQAFVTFGETLFLTRSPVNLLAFASLSQGGAEIWQVVLGSLIGAAVIWMFALLVKSGQTVPEATSALLERLGYGIATAAGALIIVIGAQLIGFEYVGWALLSFCIILSVGTEKRRTRSQLRLVGSVAGVVLAVLISVLPAPIPLIVALLCLVLCVAYINAGNYALFVLFLTPAILITTASEHSVFVLAAYRLEALAFATVIALICSITTQRIIERIRARDANPDSSRSRRD